MHQPEQLLIFLILAVLGYYWFEWRTFSNFVEAIDHHPTFMQDFAGHYYPMSRQILQNPQPVSGYFYPSFFALILVPISTFALPTALTIWAVIQFLCLVAFCVYFTHTHKLPPLGAILFVGLCITSFPILHNIKWGQVSTMILLCTVVAFFESKQNKSILSGILLGVATAIKFYPAYFLVYFILKRNIRLCVSFGLSVLLFYFVLPATVIGLNNWVEFEKTANSSILGVDWVTNDVNSQYITHVGLRLMAKIFGNTPTENIGVLLAMVGYSIVLLSIVVVWFLQKTDMKEKFMLSLVVLFCMTPFLLRTSWPHYFVYLPFCQATLLGYWVTYCHQGNRWRKVLFVFPISSMLLSSIFVFNFFPHWSTYNEYGVLFWANLLVLVGVYSITAQQSMKLMREFFARFMVFFRSEYS
jgi:hypothetical protein